MSVVSCNGVRHLQVPQYENLSMPKILDFLAQYEEMHHHMPAETHEIAKLPRGWVINVGATVVGQPFVEWVQQKIAERNAAMAKERNLLIKMNPQLAAAFKASTAVSVSHGNAAHMLKEQSKRRRTKAQIDADKEKKQRDDAVVQERLAAAEEMRQELSALKAMNENNQAAYDQLCGLIQRGHVVRNEDGSCSVPVAEQQERMAANGIDQ